MDKILQVSSLPDHAAANGNHDTRLPTPRNKKKQLVIVLLGFILLVCVASGVWFSGLMPKRFHHRVAALQTGPIFVSVPEIITNLSGSNGQDTYAKLKVVIEVKNTQAAKLISKDMPRFTDMFQTYLRAMQPDELHGASGTYRLREALIARARIVAAPASIQDVLFEELIVQ